MSSPMSSHRVLHKSNSDMLWQGGTKFSERNQIDDGVIVAKLESARDDVRSALNGSGWEIRKV